MTFKDRNSAIEWFRQYKKISDEINFEDYWLNYSTNVNIGDWLLFKHIKYKYEQNCNKRFISRPILGLVVGHTVWDMSLVLEFVENRRSFHWNSNIKGNLDSIAQINQEIQFIQFWTDNIVIIGHWKYKPSFSNLKESFKIFDRKEKFKKLK